MMDKVISVYKPQGITPLEAINIFKAKYSQYLNETLSYAGRLDPMAEGLLLLIVGEENKYRKKYEDLKKTYESEIILGISTDTFDALGIVYEVKEVEITHDGLKKALESFKGKQVQLYPPYSSKTVLGKPLYWWARQNLIRNIQIPKRNIEIDDIKLISFEIIKSKDLISEVKLKIINVKGDFRQEQILENWEKVNKNSNFIKIKIVVSCSSGTYIRRIASDLGVKLESGAFALSIKRISVGDYKLEKALRLNL